MRDKPIHISVINNNIEQVEKYLKNGIDIDIKGEYSCTPLHYACQNGNLEMIRVLLKFNANVNSKNSYSTSYPLFDAVTAIDEDNYYQILKLLIDAGADIHRVDSFGNTLLHYAVEKENLDLINLLISLGIDINKSERYDNDRALDYAYFQKNHKIINRLIESGAESKKSTL